MSTPTSVAKDELDRADTPGDTLLVDLPSYSSSQALLDAWNPIYDLATAKKLGRGAFGEALLVRRVGTDKEFVVKSIIIEPRKEHRTRTIARETLALLELRHPLIVKYVADFGDTRVRFIVTEHCPLGNLSQHLLDNDNAPKDCYAVQLLALFDFLHNKTRYMHRDIKPENVFVSEVGHIKLGDFGLVKDVSAGPVEQTVCGTKGYAAPEVFQSTGTDASGRKTTKYGRPADIYSLGVTLYEIYTGKLPFKGPHASNTPAPPFPGKSPIPAPLREPIRMMISYDPRPRPIISELMGQDWVQNHIRDCPSPGCAAIRSAEYKDVIIRAAEEREFDVAAAAAYYERR